MGVFNRQQEAQCGQRPDPLDLSQQLRLWVLFAAQPLDLSIQLGDCSSQSVDELQQLHELLDEDQRDELASLIRTGAIRL